MMLLPMCKVFRTYLYTFHIAILQDCGLASKYWDCIYATFVKVNRYKLFTNYTVVFAHFLLLHFNEFRFWSETLGRYLLYLCSNMIDDHKFLFSTVTLCQCLLVILVVYEKLYSHTSFRCLILVTNFFFHIQIFKTSAATMRKWCQTFSKLINDFAHCCFSTSAAFSNFDWICNFMKA